MLMQMLFAQPGIGMSVANGFGGSGLSIFSYPNRRPSCRGVTPF